MNAYRDVKVEYDVLSYEVQTIDFCEINWQALTYPHNDFFLLYVP